VVDVLEVEVVCVVAKDFLENKEKLL
ncbi:unnamed protein product, partial [Adineta steineri]